MCRTQPQVECCEQVDAVVSLKLSLAETQSDLDAASQRCHDLESRMEALRREMSALTEQRDAALDEAEDLREKYTKVRSYVSSMQSQAHESAKEKVILRVTVERLESENEGLKNTMKRQRDENGRLRRTNERLEDACIGLRYQKGELMKECQRLRRANSSEDTCSVAMTSSTSSSSSLADSNSSIHSCSSQEGSQDQEGAGHSVVNFTDEEANEYLEHFEEVFYSMRKLAEEEQEQNEQEKENAKMTEGEKKNKFWASLAQNIPTNTFRASLHTRCASMAFKNSSDSPSPSSGRNMGSQSASIAESTRSLWSAVYEEGRDNPSLANDPAQEQEQGEWRHNSLNLISLRRRSSSAASVASDAAVYTPRNGHMSWFKGARAA